MRILTPATSVVSAVVSILVTGVVTVGCTNTSPTIGVLNQSAIPRVTFNGQTDRALEVATLDTVTALKGECDPRVRGIEVRVLSVGTNGKLDVISEGTPTLECGASKFGATLKALRDLIPGAVSNQKYVIEFRAVTAGGVSDPSLLSLIYVRELPERVRVTAGGTESGTAPGARLAASAHFRADVRLTHRVNAADATAGDAVTRATSAHYQLRAGRAGQTSP